MSLWVADEAGSAQPAQCRKSLSAGLFSAWRQFLHQFFLAGLELLAERFQFVVREDLARPLEHFVLFLVGVVLDEFLQHLGATTELFRIDGRLLQIRQHEISGCAVLLKRLEIDLFVFGILARLPESRIEDLFLDGGVDLQFERDLLQQLGAAFGGALAGFGEFLQQLANLLVVLSNLVASMLFDSSTGKCKGG